MRFPGLDAGGGEAFFVDSGEGEAGGCAVQTKRPRRGVVETDGDKDGGLQMLERRVLDTRGTAPETKVSEGMTLVGADGELR